MTSNPVDLRKSHRRQHAYDDLLNSLRPSTDLDAKARYEMLAIRDIQDAADLLRPVYDSTKRRDGYVSLEVSPYLARDTQGHDRRSAPAVEGRRPRERDDQGSRHGRGIPGDPAS